MRFSRMRQRLRNLARGLRPYGITLQELDENTGRLIDAALQSLVFCLSLLALVTCLARLPPLPAPVANPQPAMPAWPDPQGPFAGIAG
jgi:hypothetical protein